MIKTSHGYEVIAPIVTGPWTEDLVLTSGDLYENVYLTKADLEQMLALYDPVPPKE